jgi:hypothetical protein
MSDSQNLLTQIEMYASDLEEVLIHGNPRLRRNIVVRTGRLCSHLKPANSYESEVYETFLALVRRLHQLSETRPTPHWKDRWAANRKLLSHFQNVSIRL